MRTSSFIKRALLCAAALGILGGCGAETPPYEELPLRDALSAAPDVIAALPEEARRDVAERLEEAHRAGGEETPIIEADIPTAPALVRTADAEREEADKDAIVLGTIEPLAGGFVIRGVNVGAPGEGTMELPALSGAPATSTAALEEAALKGRAGEILGALGARVGAHDLVRTTGVPAGVVVMDGTMYVNASWLVALSALDSAGAPSLGAAPAGAPAVKMSPPPKAPQSVRANPYKLPGSINECGFDVKDVCTCAASLQCDHTPTDATFANAQLECEWVNGAPERGDALCVLALMSIEALRDCVRASGSKCDETVISSRDDALAFVANAACVEVLDACLQYGKPAAPVSSGSGGGSCNNSCGNCEGCSCDGCNDDVGDCNDNCSGCNDNCRDCNDNCSDCNDNCEECDRNQQDCRDRNASGGSSGFGGDDGEGGDDGDGGDGGSDGSGGAGGSSGASGTGGVSGGGGASGTGGAGGAGGGGGAGGSAAFKRGAACKMASAQRLNRGAESPRGPVPFMGAFWLLGPAGYIVRRIRRRA